MVPLYVLNSNQLSSQLAYILWIHGTPWINAANQNSSMGTVTVKVATSIPRLEKKLKCLEENMVKHILCYLPFVCCGSWPLEFTSWRGNSISSSESSWGCDPFPRGFETDTLVVLAGIILILEKISQGSGHSSSGVVRQPDLLAVHLLLWMSKGNSLYPPSALPFFRDAV